MVDRSYYWVSLCAMLAAVVWAVWLGEPAFPLDDAYIAQHSAASFWEARDPRFLDATPLEGATSFIHVTLLALFGAVLPLNWAQAILAVLAFLAYVMGILTLARGSHVPPLWAMAVTLLSVLTGMSVYHFANGLETGLAMAAVTWALVLFEKPPSSSWPYIFLGVLPFIRPELSALAGLLFLRVAWIDRNSPRQVLANAVPMATVAMMFAMFLLWRTGHVLPNTMEAKQYFFAEGMKSAAWKFRATSGGVGEFIVEIGLTSLGVVGLIRSPWKWIAPVFVGALLVAFYIKLPGGLSHNYHRYLYVLLPLVLAGWIAAVSAPKQDGTVAKWGLCIAIAASVLLLPLNLAVYAEGVAHTRHDIDGASRWATQHAGPDTPILIHDAGYISIIGSQPLVDLVGLKTPSSVDIHKAMTWPNWEARNAAAIDAIAEKSGAGFFIVFDEWDKFFRLTDALRATGWSIERADVERGESSYKVYRIEKGAER